MTMGEDAPHKPISARSSAPSASPPTAPVARHGHEGGFVQPSSYLRPRGHSRPMTPAHTERAVDRDERLGLVSSIAILLRLSPSRRVISRRSVQLGCPVNSTFGSTGVNIHPHTSFLVQIQIIIAARLIALFFFSSHSVRFEISSKSEPATTSSR